MGRSHRAHVFGRATLSERAGRAHGTISSISTNKPRRTLSRALKLLLALPLACALTAAERPSVHAIFRSTDAGQSWTRSDAGLPGNARINALASFGTNVLAGTDSGIFSSSDAGTSWRSSPSATAGGRIISFAALGQTMFAGSDRNGLFVSSDEGATWNPVKTASGSEPPKLRSLFAREGTLYAGTDMDGVFQSVNHGQSWSHMKRGLPSLAQVFSMASVNNTLFAGLYSQGLYCWNQAEQSWAKAGTVKPLVLASVGDTLVAGHNPGGIYWSSDSGKTWGHASGSPIDVTSFTGAADTGLPANAPVWELAAGAGLVFAGASSGIYISADKGRTWTRPSLGLPSESPGVSFLVTKDYVLAGTIVKKVETLKR